MNKPTGKLAFAYNTIASMRERIAELERQLAELRAQPTAQQVEDAPPPIARAIQYPHEWDTAAYPTLESALHELAAWYKITAAVQADGGTTDAERYAYLIDCDYMAAKKYLPDLGEVKYKAKLREKHDAALQAGKEKRGA